VSSASDLSGPASPRARARKRRGERGKRKKKKSREARGLVRFMITSSPSSRLFEGLGNSGTSQREKGGKEKEKKEEGSRTSDSGVSSLVVWVHAVISSQCEPGSCQFERETRLKKRGKKKGGTESRSLPRSSEA